MERQLSYGVNLSTLTFAPYLWVMNAHNSNKKRGKLIKIRGRYGD
jgi:hypothetical protein